MKFLKKTGGKMGEGSDKIGDLLQKMGSETGAYGAYKVGEKAKMNPEIAAMLGIGGGAGAAGAGAASMMDDEDDELKKLLRDIM